MDELIMRAANLIGYGAKETGARATLVAETQDEGVAFLILCARRLLARGDEERPA